jgi:hypothetical protein
MIVELANAVSSNDKGIEGYLTKEQTCQSPLQKGKKTIRICKEQALGSNLHFPWIHSRELRPDDFHSDSVSPLRNHAPVSPCRNARATL